jgi:hypothetical protein
MLSIVTAFCLSVNSIHQLADVSQLLLSHGSSEECAFYNIFRGKYTYLGQGETAFIWL